MKSSRAQAGVAAVAVSASAVALIVIGGSVSSSGCCTAVLAESVSLTIRDDASHCPQSVHLTVVHDGQTEEIDLTMKLSPSGASGSASSGSGGGECLASTGFGVEETGDWSFKVTTADGRTASADVSVDGDTCHVETESVTLTLQ